jgi:ATP-binding cassette subfamily F protein 3
MIRIENITKSFGSQALFEGVSFKINSRERVGLVGRNGHGKTTLFRIIVDEESVEEGAIIIPRNYRIGYVHQQIEFTEKSVLSEGMKCLPESERDHHWKVEKILAGLGFSQADMERDPLEFSGGYQVRLNLAKVLVSEPDLLLLDEPTNYLDITSIRWVERFLLNWPHEVMLITHDRSFMDRIITHTVGIHRRKVRKITGDTGKYYAQLAQDEEIYEKTRVNDERRRKEIEQFITRFRAKARLSNLVQSRIKTLKKTEKRERLENIKSLEFSFRSSPFPGKHVMTASGLSFSYETDKSLIKDFNISIRSKERIFVVGKNGKGKTTLLKLLAGTLNSQHGEVTYNPRITRGFFEQTNIKSLVDGRTVEEEILSSHPDVGRQAARNICGAMMFEGDDALKKISVLSGGEKSRVMLGKLLVTPVNLLLLDEPTNHLDMESCDALLVAIDNFDGVVIMVTHNEMFLNALAQRLVVFQNNRIEVFEGNYGSFLEKIGWEEESPAHKSAWEETAQEQVASKPAKKEIRRRRSEIITERGRVLKPLKQGIAKAEGDIEKFEDELEELNQAMQKASQNHDGKKIAELSRSIHKCRSEIDSLFDRLEGLTETLEERRGQFDKKLKELES